jgi:hypothetical protein
MCQIICRIIFAITCRFPGQMVTGQMVTGQLAKGALRRLRLI